MNKNKIRIELFRRQRFRQQISLHTLLVVFITADPSSGLPDNEDPGNILLITPELADVWGAVTAP